MIVEPQKDRRCEMNRMPGFTAEASLCKTSEHYRLVGSWLEGPSRRGIIPQQDLIPPIPGPPLLHCSPCADGEQFCRPPPGFGLRCFVRSCGGPLFHCSPCVDGDQFCCPPPGFGIPCYVRRCG